MINVRRIIKVNEIEKIPLPMEKGKGGYVRILIDKETTGAKNYSLLLSEVDPGFSHVKEIHEVEHGFFILSGQGIITINGKNYEVGSNTAIYVPSHTPHQMKSVGTQPLKYIVLYAPPGPEMTIKKGARENLKDT